MKIKLDENLGQRGADIFRAAGFDVATVAEQGLTSAHDRNVIAVCSAEERCLVSLDLDFANPLLFKPSKHAGIAVLRMPPKPTADDLFQAMHTLVAGLGKAPIRGKLWIVQRDRIRQYRPEDDDGF